MVTLPGFDGSKNLLILGSPRSGTHPLASVLKQQWRFRYIGETGMAQESATPWRDFDIFCEPHAVPVLAHAVQSRAKLGAIVMVPEIKRHTYILALRRRDKVSQFASWIYFRNIGAIYNFDHRGRDYVAPASFEVTYDDIEQFVIDQIIDDQFNADAVVYYEDLDLGTSIITRNQYCFDPKLMIRNIELVQQHLAQWKYSR